MTRKDIIFYSIIIINLILAHTLVVIPSNMVLWSLMLPLIILIIAKNVSKKFNNWLETELWRTPEEPKKPKLTFGNAPVGTRFKFPNFPDEVWIILENYPDTNGLIVKWNGNVTATVEDRQSRCSWVDDNHDFDTEINAI